MQLYLKQEYGPEYVESNIISDNFFMEPTYFELKDDKIVYIIDKKGAYCYNDDKFLSCPKKDIGIPEIKSVIMDSNGNAYGYNELDYVCWKGHIEIKVNGQHYIYKYDPIFEPETIQLISKKKALLTLRKRQLIVLISDSGDVLWQFGDDMVPGIEKRLMVPIFSILLDSENILICDGLNSRVIEVDSNGEIIWQYGKEKKLGSVDGLLWKPTCARRIYDGTTIIADSKNNRIIYVSKDKEIIHSLGTAVVKRMHLNYPRSIQEIPNGNWLIANTHMNSIVEVNPDNREIIRCIGKAEGFNFFWPRCAVYSDIYSEIIIGDGLNNRLLFVDYKTLKIKKVLVDYELHGERFSIADPHHIAINKSNHNLLLTLSERNEVVEITHSGYGVKRWTNLSDPHSAVFFEKGIIIANSNNNSIEVIYNNGSCISIESILINGLQIETLNRPRFALPYKQGILILDTANQRVIYTVRKNKCWEGQIVDINYADGPTIKILDNARWIELVENRIIITDTENCRVMCLEIAIN